MTAARSTVIHRDIPPASRRDSQGCAPTNPQHTSDTTGVTTSRARPLCLQTSGSGSWKRTEVPVDHRNDQRVSAPSRITYQALAWDEQFHPDVESRDQYTLALDELDEWRSGRRTLEN